MKIINNYYLQTSNVIHLHGLEWLEKQRVAGKCAAATLSLLSKEIQTGKHTSLSLSRLAESFIKDHGFEPTFKGFHGFPEAVCISTNEVVVHGLPIEKPFEEGDVVGLDLGVTNQGAIADTAITVIVGNPKSTQHTELIEATYRSLRQAIANVSVGKKMGIIGETIHKIGQQHNYSIITNYGGHGIGVDKPHTPPFVSNKSKKEEGIIIQNGLCLAIEPMFTLGDVETKIADDKWSVYTKDIGAHFEHTIFFYENKTEIITLREEEFL